MSTPNLEDVIEAGIESALQNIYTAQPARVISFDPGTWTITAQPLIKVLYKREDGSVQALPQPIIPSVPVAYPWSGTTGMVYPLAPGSTVLLIHTHTAIDSWQMSNGTDLVDPQDTRHHNITDAIAIPGILTKKQAKGAPIGDNLVLYTPNKIILGGGAPTSPVIRKSDLISVLTSLLSDPAVSAALASGIGVPAALATYFGNPANTGFGSSVVEAAD